MIESHDPEQVELLIERYLRQEMTPEEERQWEEHYLSCNHCYGLLAHTEKVARFVRGVAAAETKTAADPARDHGWRSFLEPLLRPLLTPPLLRPAYATAVALVAIGIAGIVGWMRVGTLQRRLDDVLQPTIPLASYSLSGPHRGIEDPGQPEGPAIALRRSDEAFLLRIPALISTEPSSVFRAFIEGPKGSTVWTSDALRLEGAARSLRLFCHGTFFEPGTHVLRVEEIRPADGRVLQTLSFPFSIVTAPEP